MALRTLCYDITMHTRGGADVCGRPDRPLHEVSIPYTGFDSANHLYHPQRTFSCYWPRFSPYQFERHASHPRRIAAWRLRARPADASGRATCENACNAKSAHHSQTSATNNTIMSVLRHHKLSGRNKHTLTCDADAGGSLHGAGLVALLDITLLTIVLPSHFFLLFSTSFCANIQPH